MPERVIENPVINSSYVEPTRHFRFDENDTSRRTPPRELPGITRFALER